MSLTLVIVVKTSPSSFIYAFFAFLSSAFSALSSNDAESIERGFSVLSANYILPDYQPKFSFVSAENESPFEYKLEPDSFIKESTQEILGEEINTSDYDFVIVEIPSVTHHAYPPGLIKDADFGILVTRANRPWTSSDENSLAGVMQFMKFDPLVLLNGVQAETLEVLLGELPRRRSRIRRAIKKMVKLQFFERHTLRK